jgi:hypothetical protein
MVLLREVISGRIYVLIIGQKEVKSHKEISLFCDLKYIYRGIDLKLWNIEENNIFFDIPKLQQKIRLANF